jgi:hypothetical protein
MRKKLITIAAAAALAVFTAVPAVAGGNGDVAKIHPGHQGYVASGGANGGAAPVSHFDAHGGPGYEGGAGGWGGAVSYVASTYGGLKKAHGG